MKRSAFNTRLAVLSACIALGSIEPSAAGPPVDTHTLLYLSMDGTFTGAAGETPNVISNVTFTSGVLGAAAWIPAGSGMTFASGLYYLSANNIHAEEGSLEFWIRPAWNGGDWGNHCVLSWGTHNGVSFTKDGANNLRSLFNRWNVVAPEVGAVLKVDSPEWSAGVWHHVGFTWRSIASPKGSVCNLYVDGKLRSQSYAPYPIYPPTVQGDVFRIGGESGDANLDAAIDELRISDIERPAEEILESYLRGSATEVRIDIKPGSNPNSVNLYSRGGLPVAVLGAADLAVAWIDPASVRFGRKGTEAVPSRWSTEDVNGDGRADLVLQFPTTDTGFCCGDEIGRVTGQLLSGRPIWGSDSIRLVRCPPYTLGVTALQDVRKVTDVLLSIKSIAGGVAPPTLAQHVQLKSFDLEDRLFWTRNEMSVPLTPMSSDTSVGDVVCDDLGRYQPIQAQVQVLNPQERNMEVLRAEGRVVLRPDLAVELLRPPTNVVTWQTVILPLGVRELNGDLGAVANVRLWRDGKIVDVAKAIQVGAHSNAVVVFSFRLATPGKYQFVVDASDVTPGDYDPSNNRIAFAFEAVEPPLQSVWYNANYSLTSFVYSNRYEYAWGGGSHLEFGRRGSVSDSLWIPDTFIGFPLWHVSVAWSADGILRETNELIDVPATSTEYGPDYIRMSTWQRIGDNIYFRAESYLGYSGTRWSSVTVERYAGDTVYFSERHSKDWGNSSASGTSKYGSFLLASNSVGIELILQASVGRFGGSALIAPLETQPYDYSWDSMDPLTGWGEIGFERGVQTYGWSSGMTKP